jgi:hypothetical protein
MSYQMAMKPMQLREKKMTATTNTIWGEMGATYIDGIEHKNYMPKEWLQKLKRTPRKKLEAACRALIRSMREDTTKNFVEIDGVCAAMTGTSTILYWKSSMKVELAFFVSDTYHKLAAR